MADELLKEAFDAMQAAPANDGRRFRFFEAMIAQELTLLLAENPEGADVKPALIEAEDGQMAAVFSSPEEVADFTAGEADVAVVPGRDLVGLLANAELGLWLNPGSESVTLLLNPEEVGDLADLLEEQPVERARKLVSLAPPDDLSDDFLHALDRRLASLGGLVARACLTQLKYDDESSSLGIILVGASKDGEERAGQVLSDFGRLSDNGPGFDLIFLDQTDPLIPPLLRQGLWFDLPVPKEAQAPEAPGLNPDKPPKLI